MRIQFSKNVNKRREEVTDGLLVAITLYNPRSKDEKILTKEMCM